MTVTQLLLIAILLLASAIAAHSVKEAIHSHRRQLVDIDARHRQIGTFGSLDKFSTDAAALSGGSFPFKALLLVVLLGIGGAAFTAVWSEAHPDIRTSYGRAYERCVAKEQLSRWRVDEVRRCVDGMRAN